MNRGSSGGPALLDEHIDPDYQPTEKEVEEYAEWLGMDLELDRDLFWIARAGLKAPLPEPWKPCESEDNEIFYFNFETGESVWDHPCDDHYRKLYEKHRTRKGDKPDKKEKKEKKDKKGRGRNNSFDLGNSNDSLDLGAPPKMDLPKPGESLFGKASKNKLVFDCKPKAKAEPAKNAPPPPQAPSQSPQASFDRFEAEKPKLEAEHNERLQRLEREYEDKRRDRLRQLEEELKKDVERRRVDYVRQLQTEMERQGREEAERKVEETLRPWREQLERDRRAKLEREVEERLRPSAAAFERDARAKLEREAEDRARSSLPDIERDARTRLERQAEDQARSSLPEIEREARAKLERDAEDRARSASGDIEREARSRLQREAEDRARAGLADIEREARQRLEREAEDRVRSSSYASIEESVRSRLEREAEDKARASLSTLEDKARTKLEQDAESRARESFKTLEDEAKAKLQKEAEDQARSALPDLEREARAKLERETEERLRTSSAAEVEQEIRAKIQREVEEKVRSDLPKLEQEATAKLREEAHQKSLASLPDIEREIKAKLEREAADRLNIASGGASVGPSPDLDQQAKDKAELEVAQKMRAILPDMEREAKAKLEREVEERVKVSLPDLEKAARAKLEQEAHTKVQAGLPDIEASVRSKLESDTEQTLRRQNENKRAQLESELAADFERQSAALRTEHEQRLAKLREENEAVAAAAASVPGAPAAQAPAVSQSDGAGSAELAAMRTELGALRSSKAALEARVAELLVQASTTSEELSKKRQEADELQGVKARLASAEALVEEERSRASKTSADLAKSHQDANELQVVKSRLADAEAAAQEAQSKVSKLQAALGTAEAELQASKTAASAAASAGEGKEAALKDALAGRAEAQQETSKLKVQLDAAEAVASNFKVKVAGLEAQLSSQSDQTKGEDAAAAALRAQVHQLTQEMEGLRGKLTASSEDAAQKLQLAQDAASAHATEVAKLRADILEKTRDFEKQRANKSLDDSQTSLMQARLDEAQAAKEGLAKELQALRAAAAVASSEAKVAAAPLPTLASVPSIVPEEKKKLEEQIAELQKDGIKLRQELASKEAESASLRLRLESASVATASIPGNLGVDNRNSHLLQQLQADLGARDAQVYQLKTEVSAAEAERSRVGRECAQLQRDAALNAGELQQMRLQLGEKESLVAEISTLRARILEQRSGNAAAEVQSSEAWEQLRGLRVELQEQRSQAAQEAHRLRSELWEERSAASTAAISAAGEVASLRAAAQAATATAAAAQAAATASPAGRVDAVEGAVEAALRAELAERRRCGEEELRTLQVELRKKGSEAGEAKTLHAEYIAAERQAALQHSEDELQVRKAREEMRAAYDKLSAMESMASIQEDRAKRLGSEADAERQQGESRMQRLRAEVRRLEQELDEASTRVRLEARRHDEALGEVEKELRATQRQLAIKEADLSDARLVGDATSRREEATLSLRIREVTQREAAVMDRQRLLDEREQVLRGAERMLRQRQSEIEGDLERVTREVLASSSRFASSATNSGVAAAAATWPNRGAAAAGSPLDAGLSATLPAAPDPSLSPQPSSRQVRKMAKSPQTTRGPRVFASKAQYPESLASEAAALAGAEALHHQVSFTQLGRALEEEGDESLFFSGNEGGADPEFASELGNSPAVHRQLGSSSSAEAEADITASAVQAQREILAGAALTINPKLQAIGEESSQALTQAARLTIPAGARPASSPQAASKAHAPAHLTVEEEGMLELARARRRSLKKQRAALEAEFEQWRQDVARTATSGSSNSGQRRILADVKAVLDDRFARINESMRETRAVERMLTQFHSQAEAAAAGTRQLTPSAFNPEPRQLSSACAGAGVDVVKPSLGGRAIAAAWPGQDTSALHRPADTEAAALALLQRWQGERLTPRNSGTKPSDRRRSGSMSARVANSTAQRPVFNQPLTARGIVAGHEAWLRNFRR